MLIMIVASRGWRLVLVLDAWIRGIGTCPWGFDAAVLAGDGDGFAWAKGAKKVDGQRMFGEADLAIGSKTLCSFCPLQYIDEQQSRSRIERLMLAVLYTGRRSCPGLQRENHAYA